MRPKARIATVINLDTCAGCPACTAARPPVEAARHGGWELTRLGRLRLRNGGGRLRGLTGAFPRPAELPPRRRHGRPWTYGGDDPAARARLAFEQAFRVSLRPSCADCLNPPCGETCSPDATGCAYASGTCVGGLPYVGVMLYDADKMRAAASAAREQDLYAAQLGVFLDPEDARVRVACERAGITGDWLEAARRSPVRALISTYRVALPPHPEDRTLPMVWYVPPLSPVVDALAEGGGEARSLFGAVDTLRVPLEQLADVFTAGDVGPVRAALRRLTAMRSHMRAVGLGEEPDPSVPAAVGLGAYALEDLYRLLATAPHDERTVVPAGAESPVVIRTTRTPEAEEI
ncbi:hypothetical protein ACIPMW_12445 [Streptomyces sp. NPDC086669]|uniref:hypothetical protein n=1 Tax=Streptomyces sp. NPDC086669 TaxID=3365753 RepID=UPI00380A82CD